MNVCVFCSARDVDEKYNEDARKFAQLLAKHKHTLVWGGTKSGVMGLIATTARKYGGKTIGVGSEMFRDRLFDDADELIIERSLVERKATMLKRSDAFVVMSGGLGTLDEVTEILELKKHRLHERSVLFLNTDNFFEGMKTQLERMEREGFLPRALDELVYFAQDAQEAIEYINAHG